MTSYHGWTHAPKAQGGTDPIPLAFSEPWVLLTAGGQTLPGDGGFDTMLFDGLYWDPLLVSLNPADPTDGSDSTFGITVQTFGGTDYYLCTVKPEGWYELEFYAQIDDTGDGAPGVYWEVDIQTDSAGGAFPGPEGMNEARIWNGTDIFSEVMRHRYRFFATASRGWLIQSRQSTGVDKGLGGWMLMSYLGGLGGAADNAWEVTSL